MLKAQIFHANALDKLPKVQEQITQLLGHIGEGALVSVNATEFGPAGTHDFYSYTVLVIYRAKE
ncbi:MAG: hypothetical protein KBC96_15055 [Armatimonadetes bacterium]|nr:hypothetical protein [Armatimonadota bacterium]